MADIFCDDAFGKFAQMTNDRQHPELRAEADVILFGVSGGGKTTMSKELARRGIKAANIPFVYDPWEHKDTLSQLQYYKELGMADLKVFAKEGKPKLIYLFCNVKRIIDRRRGISKYNDTARVMYNTDYAMGPKYFEKRAEILLDVMFANRMADQIGCVQIDTTRQTVQETADEIVALLSASPDQSQNIKKVTSRPYIPS